MEPEADGTAEGELAAIEIRLLLEAIHAKYGYDLRGYADASMRRRVKAALARSGFERLSDLQHGVLRDPILFSTVLRDLAVRVSDLFRDPAFFLELRRHVVPVLRTYPLLKIWHAGCAGGEEAYAMAILLTEEGLYDRTQIYATDLSADALEQAKQGVYPAERLEAFAENYRQAGGNQDFSRYCTSAYGGIAMAESLRRNILFFQHNLVSDHAFGEMNVVFCRNVFIYFGDELRARVLDKLVESLRPGGFLCLGKTERLTRADRAAAFEPFAMSEAIYRYAAVR
jgi:chemotaxis protein methyltransferase CheR